MFAANESGLAAAVLANKSGAPSVLAGATQAGRQDITAKRCGLLTSFADRVRTYTLGCDATWACRV